MARILGLTGWGFSPINIYANGGSILALNIYEVGEPISEVNLNIARKEASRVFTSGKVIVNLLTSSLTIPFNYTTCILDGKPLEYYISYSAEGSKSNISSFEYIATPRGLYIYIDVSQNAIPIETLFHIYIDGDENSSTGFRGDRNYGAECMVEIYVDGSGELLSYSGGNWGWNVIGSVTLVLL